MHVNYKRESIGIHPFCAPDQMLLYGGT